MSAAGARARRRGARLADGSRGSIREAKGGGASLAKGPWDGEEFEERMVFEVVDAMNSSEADFQSIYA